MSTVRVIFFRGIPFRSVSFRASELALPQNSECLGMSTFFRGITETVPRLFRGIFSERNSVPNPSCVESIYRSYTLCIWPDSKPTKLPLSPQTKTWEGRGPQSDKHLPSPCTGQFLRKNDIQGLVSLKLFNPWLPPSERGFILCCMTSCLYRADVPQLWRWCARAAGALHLAEHALWRSSGKPVSKSLPGWLYSFTLPFVSLFF